MAAKEMTAKEKARVERSKAPPQRHYDVPVPSKTCIGCLHNDHKSDASDSIWCLFLKTWSCDHAPSCGGKAFNRTVQQFADDRAQAAKDGLANLDRLEANDLTKDKK
jgi:hypothetical protein